MQKTLRDFIRFASVPLILLVVSVVLIGTYSLLGFPQPNEIVDRAADYYARYGYWVVLIAALVEGTLFINWYLPGSVICVLGVVFARTNGLSPMTMVAIIIAAFIVTSALNYAIGRFGWYHLFLHLGLREPLEKIRTRVERRGLPIVFATFLHPNIGALAATSVGILRLPFFRFLACASAAIIIWNTIWGAVAYHWGTWVLSVLSTWFIVPTLLIWIIYLTVRFYLKKNITPSTVP